MDDGAVLVLPTQPRSFGLSSGFVGEVLAHNGTVEYLSYN